jgi:hypothetical protein
MRRAISLFVATFALAGVVAVTGCTKAQLNQIRGANAGGTAAKKDCAACEKMCAVAGDAEKNPAGVDACKADCKKNCQ